MLQRSVYLYHATIMLNLLRPEQKKKIIHEYHVRFFVLVFSLLFCIQIVAIILLIPSYAISKARSDALNSQTSTLQKQDESQEVARLNGLVNQTNGYINILSLTSTTTDAYLIIDNIVNVRGPNIKINGVVYGAQNGQNQVIIQGTAVSRQNLLDFVNQLKKQKKVLSATLPISDFSQPQNINFSLTVIMAS
jgi:hypothetical protein